MVVFSVAVVVDLEQEAPVLAEGSRVFCLHLRRPAEQLGEAAIIVEAVGDAVTA
jgi:hypothetical protein